VRLDRLIAAVPALERPVVLLEDGRGRLGRARLAWGAKRRVTVPWSRAAVGDLSPLDQTAAGRWYGVLSYDLGLPPRAMRRDPLLGQPLCDLFIPAYEVVLDLATGATTGDASALPGESAVPPGRRPAPSRFVTRSFTEEAFARAVQAIREYVAAGDVYQVNLALAERFEAAATPWEAYLRLRSINPSPWMGFADFGNWQIVSGSPELLIEAGPDGGQPGRQLLRTRPIAGTRKKTGDQAEDAAMRAELTLDAKEQAEHRMLLDLARNDLGRVAEFGTVRVRERETVEEYAHVFHLVSDVAATATARTPREIVAALFPGGTITGAPKIRAMEIIAELEPVARGAYTGAMGWLGEGGMQLNILIRSAVMRDGAAMVQAGSGIVWDSDPKREWREALRKGRAVREALGVPEP
jgi:para-aminobenzoate synthetase component 1